MDPSYGYREKYKRQTGNLNFTQAWNDVDWEHPDNKESLHDKWSLGKDMDFHKDLPFDPAIKPGGTVDPQDPMTVTYETDWTDVAIPAFALLVTFFLVKS